MSSFSESALEKKLAELSNSQQSVQTLSLWLIHHRKHAGIIVHVWHRELKRAKPSRKLTFIYLANDVIQNSKRKGPEFTKAFEGVLVDAFSHVARESEQSCKKQMERVLNIWQERIVYDVDFIQQLKLTVDESNSPLPRVLVLKSYMINHHLARHPVKGNLGLTEFVMLRLLKVMNQQHLTLHPASHLRPDI
ncbi:regulation of nuclear pre-mRNA domain-containing protein 1B-like isoform X3 [Cetorhinus maximus]